MHDNLISILQKMLGKLRSLAYTKQFDFNQNDMKIGPNETFLGGQVISLSLMKAAYKTTMKYLLENVQDYLICLKSDGMRYLLVLTSFGNQFFVSRKMDIMKINLDLTKLTFQREDQRDHVIYIFDGELIKDPLKDGSFHFQIFDCVLFNGALIIEDSYVNRLVSCEQFLQKNDFLKQFKEQEESKIRCFVKDFYKTSSVEFLLKDIANMKMYHNEIDGLIFTKINFPYLPGKSCGVLKWKPDYLNTIDFLLIENPRFLQENPQLFQNDDFYVFELYTIHNRQFVLFDFLFIFSAENYIQVQQHLKNMNIFNTELTGVIIEAKYNKELTNQKLDNFYSQYFDYDSDKIRELMNKSILKDNLSENSKALPQLFQCLEQRYNIVEKKYQGTWELMRVRDDKDLPNGFTTASNVFQGLFQENITEEFLIKNILKTKRQQLNLQTQITQSKFSSNSSPSICSSDDDFSLSCFLPLFFS